MDHGQRHILTACQDRNIRVYNVNSGKHSKTFKGSIGDDGTLIKVNIFQILILIVAVYLKSSVVWTYISSFKIRFENPKIYETLSKKVKQFYIYCKCDFM